MRLQRASWCPLRQIMLTGHCNDLDQSPESDVYVQSERSISSAETDCEKLLTSSKKKRITCRIARTPRHTQKLGLGLSKCVLPEPPACGLIATTICC